MTTSILPVSKEQVADLILQATGDKLTELQWAKFNQFAQASLLLWSGEFKGQLLCLWGLIPPTILSDQAYLWLYTTEAAKDHEFVLVRRSQIELRKMLEAFPRIVGHCEVGAERSIRWLRWLGARFGEPDGKLIPFVIRGSND